MAMRWRQCIDSFTAGVGTGSQPRFGSFTSGAPSATATASSSELVPSQQPARWQQWGGSSSGGGSSSSWAHPERRSDTAASVATGTRSLNISDGGEQHVSGGFNSDDGHDVSVGTDSAAYSVRVDGFEPSRSGRFIIYLMTVRQGENEWPIRRRYRQVAALYTDILQGLGGIKSGMSQGLPQPPAKVTVRSLLHGTLDQQHLAARSVQIQAFLDAMLRFIPCVDQCEPFHEFLCCADVANMDYDALLGLAETIGNAGEAEPPVEDSAIAALPRRRFDIPGKLEESSLAGAATSSQERCVICQDLLLDPTQDVSDQDVRILPCGHEYHFSCIAQWLKKSNTCCICQSAAVDVISMIAVKEGA